MVVYMTGEKKQGDDFTNLDSRMRLQEKIPVPRLRDTAVDHGAGDAVGTPVGILGVGGVEAGVVALADDDEGEAGQPLLL